MKMRSPYTYPVNFGRASKTITIICPFCGEEDSVVISSRSYYAMEIDKISTEEACPYLTRAYQDMIDTGICSCCNEDYYEAEAEDLFASMTL